MAGVSFKSVRKSYGETHVLKGIDIAVQDGEFLVLVGPSGCGKSTLLRSLAGLTELTSGEVWIGDRNVSVLPPKDRDVAMVFQSYALYPHMTIAENMGFALKMQKRPPAEISKAVGEAAAMLDLEALLHRYPKELSGGQRQRVAMGRAIVRRPKVFLFDEPLSNLDAKLRNLLRVELKRLHRELATTMIYVTHDQVEAMTLADRIAVLNEGHLQQLGTPQELYDSPANQFVAGFIGSPSMSFLEQQEEDCIVGVRPHDVLLSFEKNEGSVPVEVEASEMLGFESILHLRISSTKETLLARVEGEIPKEKELFAQFLKTHRFSKVSGERI
ncbi:MAG: hypothetical protein CMK59_05690 [Proteobacteria bacterium]|nr:hypothetical protein [Pseudomonadota bacterium]